MNTPKVTVIMGIYNCEKTLSVAIDSILNQTYKNWELIMCDDGSKDDTYKIACDYSEKYSNIKVLKNSKNMRLAYSLNRCLESAKGEYIARMDSDDRSLPTRFEEQVQFLDTHPEYAVVGSALTICDQDVKFYDRFYPEYPMKQIAWSTVPFAHPTIMMRKEAYLKLNGYRVCPETMRAEDLDLWFRFRMNHFDGYNLQKSLYLYQESEEDYKKRSLKAAVMTSKIVFKYYKILNVPYKYWYIGVRPVVAALLPAKLKVMYHKNKTKI